MAEYKLLYSQLFYKDLEGIVTYISYELRNGQAAEALVNDTELAIKKRLHNPLSTGIYNSIRSRQHAYRRIIVGNYIIFYVVIDDAMVVRRMLYGRRDLERFL